jgi:predicted Zn-dependent peptidase
MLEQISRIFSRDCKEPETLEPVKVVTEVSGERTYSEPMEIEQAKLAIGFRTGIPFADPLLPAALYFNSIFGAMGSSKLFRTVREQEGLAYYVYSQLERSKGLMLVSSGCKASSVERLLDLVRDMLGGMAGGDITFDEMEAARQGLLSRFRAVNDTLGARINLHLEGRVNGRTAEVETIMKAIDDVSRDQVVEVASRVKLDTVFILEPAKSLGGKAS